jgi:hypothetical protein
MVGVHKIVREFCVILTPSSTGTSYPHQEAGFCLAYGFVVIVVNADTAKNKLNQNTFTRNKIKLQCKKVDNATFSKNES